MYSCEVAVDGWDFTSREGVETIDAMSTELPVVRINKFRHPYHGTGTHVHIYAFGISFGNCLYLQFSALLNCQWLEILIE